MRFFDEVEIIRIPDITHPYSFSHWEKARMRGKNGK